MLGCKEESREYDREDRRHVHVVKFSDSRYTPGSLYIPF
jgi:hypothetical protein